MNEDVDHATYPLPVVHASAASTSDGHSASVHTKGTIMAKAEVNAIFASARFSLKILSH